VKNTENDICHCFMEMFIANIRERATTKNETKANWPTIILVTEFILTTYDFKNTRKLS
jgi:hypothetical protein